MSVPKQTSMDEIKFELLENGLDFIASGLDFVSRGATKSDLKYGVLHLWSGIELVLKARLQHEDWKLLFPSPDKADENRYKSGDFWSVGFDVCLSRLEEECGIDISDEAVNKLYAIRVRRNRLEHFAIVDTKVAIESVAAQALGVLLDFISDAFEDSSLSDHEKDLLLRIRERLTEFDAFTKSRIAEISTDSDGRRTEFTNSIECPCCFQHTLLADVNVECMFCGYRASAEDAANFFISQHQIRRSIYFCPECDNKTVIDLGAAGNAAPATQFVCFGCGTDWDEGSLEECPLCQGLEYRSYMTPMGCGDCFRGYVAQDNT
jgi:hypothetical protein